MKVTATRNAEWEGAHGWLLVDAPVAKLAIHEDVAAAACSTDDPGPDSINDFKLQQVTTTSVLSLRE